MYPPVQYTNIISINQNQMCTLLMVYSKAKLKSNGDKALEQAYGREKQRFVSNDFLFRMLCGVKSNGCR